MGLYILRRLYQSVLVIIGVTLLVFLLLRLTGDPVELFLPPGASEEMLQSYREDLGLNDPFFVQYAHFLKGAVTGDFGNSYYYNEPAMKLVLERLPATMELTAASVFITVLLGGPAGILAALFHNRTPDYIVRLLALLGQCLPLFWVGIVLMIVFAVKLHLLPTSGRGSVEHLILPAFALSLHSAATTARLLRSSMLETLNKEYILVARARGLGRGKIVLKHALKNALSAVITMLGMNIAGLLGGAVITETVFAWPGVGRLAIQAINNRDFTVVEAVVIMMAASYVLINLLVDICYALLNPKIKYGNGG
ncbi:ABC transporter permease [Paenibacillus macerans]|uniref:ABC transporter permease n=1 Tax=Paenibacillus macerans TaxID=44252 RepID=UPI002E1C745A|nr:ABC transporter permease [Paenibacillus macerans]